MMLISRRRRRSWSTPATETRSSSHDQCLFGNAPLPSHEFFIPSLTNYSRENIKNKNEKKKKILLLSLIFCSFNFVCYLLLLLLFTSRIFAVNFVPIIKLLYDQFQLLIDLLFNRWCCWLLISDNFVGELLLDSPFFSFQSILENDNDHNFFFKKKGFFGMLNILFL